MKKNQKTPKAAVRSGGLKKLEGKVSSIEKKLEVAKAWRKETKAALRGAKQADKKARRAAKELKKELAALEKAREAEEKKQVKPKGSVGRSLRNGESSSKSARRLSDTNSPAGSAADASSAAGK